MEAKSEAVTILLLNLALFLPCLSTAASSDQSFNPSVSKGPIHHDYTRFADVERHCQSVLSSATELRYDPDRAGELKYKLSFVNGDWSQDAGQAPLLPFHGSSAAAAAAGHELLEAVPLASLMLLDIDTMPRQGARNAVNVSGVLSFTITRNYPELELWPGFARLIVQLQGVYTETKSSASGGERVLCMVGDAVLPVRGSNGTDSWNFAKNHAGDGWVKPPVVADGNILLVLRYPMPATLTNRAVRGEMTSTSAASDAAYFDTIRLVSQLAGGGYDSGYQFQPEDALLDAAGAVAGCGGGGDDDDDPPLSHDSRASLCDIVYQQSNPGSKVIMEVIPNWDCKGTDAFCSRFGPFENTRAGASATSAMKEKGMAFTRSAIAVQSIQCKRTGSVGGGGTAARVAVVLRYVPPWEHQPTAATRTGLGCATVSAEGVWNASTRRACMVGCLGAGDEKSCPYRVTLSVQRTLSMARRGGIVGQIAACPPLLFQQRVNPRFISSGASRTPRMSYVYTKVDQALELRRRSGKPTRFVAKSLLSYPIVAGNDAGDMASLSNLAENLNLRFQCVARPPFVPEWVEECCYQLQILSVGSLVGSYSAPFHGRRSSKWIEALRRARAVANRQVLNVSAEFTASRNSFLSPIPVMSVEGVYDPKDGRMHLIGCRSVHAPWPELAKRGGLEDGIMDCDIEVTVDYPPTTTRWLPIGRTAKVSVSSTREEGDPLHFARTELQSVPVAYRDRQLHELVRPILEGILCITVLSVARIIFVPVAFFQLLG
ncbi:unnamed protein product [Urochloa decumbens]|uniref:DUF2921 domain-containing protein n=1 Tax=Urochloa decumbens TaxID=240449 RepID=A0ABC9H5D8_9POAL